MTQQALRFDGATYDHDRDSKRLSTQIGLKRLFLTTVRFLWVVWGVDAWEGLKMAQRRFLEVSILEQMRRDRMEHQRQRDRVCKWVVFVCAVILTVRFL